MTINTRHALLQIVLLFLQANQVVPRLLRELQTVSNNNNNNGGGFNTPSPTVAPVDKVTPKEKARNYGLLLVWGAFFLAVFVLATYFINHFLDRFCCCCVFEPEAMDQGMVSRKAQLFGLTLKERAKLLARIFPASIGWQPDETLVESATTTTRTRATPLEPSDDPLTDVQHDRVCCICLLPYEAGVHILKGTVCQHTFHYSCCMEWLKKHDECPYCRRELFTAVELRAAAKESSRSPTSHASATSGVSLSQPNVSAADAETILSSVGENGVSLSPPDEEQQVESNLRC